MLPVSLDKKQNDLLAVIQSNVPVVERPFKAIAELLSCSEQEVVEMIHDLMEKGVIRAFGPVFEARKLGYVSTLVAAEIENSGIDGFTDAMADINEITHIYLRDHVLNVWFTITARDSGIRDNIIAWTKRLPGVVRILNLPAVTVYKVSAVFGEKNAASPVSKPDRDCPPPDEEHRELIRFLQKKFPVAEKPFELAAQALGTSESWVLETVNSWIDDGVIRRFGARLDHQRAGYSANGLAAWSGIDVDALGHTFAALPRVSHCYRRLTHGDWPYELYTMVHARSDSELDDLVRGMVSLAPDAGMVVLKTLRELKKTTMYYFMEDGRWDTR
ncbi:Lrp/AsnC family transcriptional regulator [bacterium]|nr:Lrp/AsnC family transcriptional regulator [bacterium]